MSTGMRDTERGGFALPATLLAMFVIGAIVTGGFYVASQEHQVSISTDLGAQALHAAEYGLEERLSGWSNADMDALPAGVTTFGPYTVSNGSSQVGTYLIRAMPLGGRVYLVQSQGEVVRGSHAARRRVAKLVRTYTMEMPYQTAMTVYGSLSANGNALISGVDQCAADSVPGVVAVDTALVSDGGGTKERIVGDPQKVADPNLLNEVSKLDIDALTASATLHYDANGNPTNMAPVIGVEGGEQYCDKSNPNNWGEHLDQTHPCSDYYPIIHVDGNFKLTTGRGQGILIVDGDLEIAGNIEFSGIVIVKGAFKMTGTGLGTGKINGTLLALGNGQIETDNTQSGNAQVQYNSCKIAEAFNAGLRVRPFQQRAWIMDASAL